MGNSGSKGSGSRDNCGGNRGNPAGERCRHSAYEGDNGGKSSSSVSGKTGGSSASSSGQSKGSSGGGGNLGSSSSSGSSSSRDFPKGSDRDHGGNKNSSSNDKAVRVIDKARMVDSCPSNKGDKVAKEVCYAGDGRIYSDNGRGDRCYVPTGERCNVSTHAGDSGGKLSSSVSGTSSSSGTASSSVSGKVGGGSSSVSEKGNIGAGGGGGSSSSRAAADSSSRDFPKGNDRDHGDHSKKSSYTYTIPKTNTKQDTKDTTKSDSGNEVIYTSESQFADPKELEAYKALVVQKTKNSGMIITQNAVKYQLLYGNEFVNIPAYYKLLKLDLNNVGMKDSGAKLLADAIMKDLPELILVDVSGNNITKEGESYFVDALKSKFVKYMVIITETLASEWKFMFGTKEEKIEEYKGFIKEAEEKGIDTHAVVVNTGVIERATNGISVGWEVAKGFAKCKWNPESIATSYVEGKLLAKLPEKLGKALGSLINIEENISCYLSAKTEELTSAEGAALLLSELCVMGETEYCNYNEENT